MSSLDYPHYAWQRPMKRYCHFIQKMDNSKMTAYELTQKQIQQEPKTWLVTGAAGFIGSNLVESLLRLNQKVIGLDNFALGYPRNLHQVQELVGPKCWAAYQFIEGDIRDLDTCRRAIKGVDYVLHHAAMGSVPGSVADPLLANACNVTGCLNVLIAAKDEKVRRFVYATSSAVYGDDAPMPIVEDKIGRPLSPYAANKLTNELYAYTFARCYGLQTVGLRYFNVFGPRQDPKGAYAAVIPRWIESMIKNQPFYIYGDGETTRDFCYVANVVQANILAATSSKTEALNEAYNVAISEKTSLNQLYQLLKRGLEPDYPHLQTVAPIYQDFRPGDVRHSQASIAKIKNLLGFEPTHTLANGLSAALGWYKKNLV